MKSFDYNQNYFEAGMTGWHADSFEKIAGRLNQQVNMRRFKRALDVGCGDGFYGATLKKHTDYLWGADIADCLNQSDSRKYYEGYIHVDPETQLDATGKFDLIFCSEVVEHIENYQQFLCNLQCALAPGGLLFLTTTTYPCYLPIYLTRHPRDWSAKQICGFFLGWVGFNNFRQHFVMTLWDWTKGHYHGFSRRRMVKAARAALFQVEAVEYLHASPVIDTQFFLNPFKNIPLRWILLPIIRLCGTVAHFCNAICFKYDIYARNIILIATKPEV